MLAIIDRFGAMVKRSWTSGPYSVADRELWGLLNTGSKSTSGVTVTRETALGLSALWKGANIIGNGCAKAGLHRYRRIGEHGKQRDTVNPTYNLVRSRPNEYMDAFQFWRTIIVHALFEGNGYAAIERTNGGTPTSLLLLDPSVTYPVRRDGVLWYVTAVDYGEGQTEYVKLRAADMFHVRGLGYDGLCGYPVIWLCRDVIGTAIATRNHAATFFQRGAMLSGVLEWPTGSSPDETAKKSIREEWDRLYSGVNNANRVAILFGGMKFNPLAVDAQKAQMIESRNFDIVELANLLLLPPHKLGNTDRAAYNSLEMEEKSVAADAFDPWWTAIESECDTKLLTAKEQKDDSHFFRWNRRAALQTDAKAESETLKIQKEGGFITVDEGRGVLDRGELPYGLGNVIDRPNANSTTLDLNKPPPEANVNDTAFLQEYAKLLASKDTSASVLFNLTDAKALLQAVNVPLDAGYDAPWLPVIASNGQLVNGDVTTGPGGEIVGGATEKPPKPEPIAPDPAETDTEDDDNQQNSARFRAKMQIIANRDCLEDVLQRMVTRIRHKAEREFSGNFVAFVEGIEDDHGEYFDRAASPVLTGICAGGGQIGPVRHKFFSEIRDKLLLAAECKRSELPARVGFVLTMAESHCRKLATMAALSGVR